MNWKVVIVLLQLVIQPCLPIPASCLKILLSRPRRNGSDCQPGEDCVKCPGPADQAGVVDHLPEPRIDDYILDGYGAACNKLTLNVTLKIRSVGEWIEEEINHDEFKAVVYYSNSNSSDYKRCPNQQGLSCEIDVFSELNDYVFVTVNVSDNKGNWKKHCLKRLLLLPRAKVYAVEGLFAQARSSSTIILVYNGTVLVEKRDPIQYQVLLNATNFHHQVPLLIFNSTAPQHKVYQRTLTGLIPNGVYMVTVWARPVTRGKAKTPTGILSDPAHTRVKMPEDVPARNPDWAPGQFSIDNDCGDNCNSVAVTIFWLGLPEALRHGIIQHIVEVEGRRTSLPAHRTSYQIDNIQKGLTYKIKLIATTSVGKNKSVLPKLLVFDARMLAAPRPINVESIRSEDGSVIQVTWEESKRLNGRQVRYHVVWCEKASYTQKQKCKGELQSFTVGNKSSAQIPLSLVEGHRRHLAGVYMEENGDSTGIVWSPCMYQSGMSPKAVPPAEIYGQSGHVVVKVRQYQCQESAVPTKNLQYYISYCLTEDNDTCKGNVVVKVIGPEELNEQLMYPVEANHFYKVVIYADAHGQKSPKRVENLYVPASSQGFPGLVVGIVVAAVLFCGLVIVIIVLIKFRRYVKQNPVPIKRTENMLLEVTDPGNDANLYDEPDDDEADEMAEAGNDHSQDGHGDTGVVAIRKLSDPFAVSLESKDLMRMTNKDMSSDYAKVSLCKSNSNDCDSGLNSGSFDSKQDSGKLTNPFSDNNRSHDRGGETCSVSSSCDGSEDDAPCVSVGMIAGYAGGSLIGTCHDVPDWMLP